LRALFQVTEILVPSLEPASCVHCGLGEPSIMFAQPRNTLGQGGDRPRKFSLSLLEPADSLGENLGEFSLAILKLARSLGENVGELSLPLLEPVLSLGRCRSKQPVLLFEPRNMLPQERDHAYQYS